jgi:hypothetical protein
MLRDHPERASVVAVAALPGGCTIAPDDFLA